MMVKRIERRFGRGDHLYIEALEQGSGAKGRGRQGFIDAVEIEVRRRRFQLDFKAECLGEDPVQPLARGRSAKRMEPFGEGSPNLARTDLRGRAVLLGYAERVQGNPQTVEHPKDVVVGLDQELGCILEGGVGGEPGRVRMAVRADDRQIGHLGIEAARDGANIGRGWKKPVRMQMKRAHSL